MFFGEAVKQHLEAIILLVSIIIIIFCIIVYKKTKKIGTNTKNNIK
jgi:hypothetical protein